MVIVIGGSKARNSRLGGWLMKNARLLRSLCSRRCNVAAATPRFVICRRLAFGHF